MQNFGIKSELDFFLDNFSSLLDSGLDVLTALDTVGKEVRTRRMKKVMQEIKVDVGDGMPLWRALEKHHVVKDYVLSLIKIGEQAGRLVDNLKVVVLQQQKERLFKSKMRSAMAYPVLVFVVAVLLGLGLAMFVLPRLAGVFSSLTIELPLPTRILLIIGAFMREWGYVVAPVTLIILSLLLWILFGWRKTRQVGQWMLFKLPGVKRLIQEIELARFGYIFGTLLGAGLPIVDSVKSLRDATTFYSYRKLYDHLSVQINFGESIRESLKSFKNSHKLIPASAQQMIIAGEQSGRLSATLENIGRIYEGKTESTAKNLTTVLEPVLLIVVWFGVAGVALSVIMPVYGLLGSINDARNNRNAPAQESVVTATPEPTPAPVAVNTGELQLIDGVPALNIREDTSTSSEIIGRLVPGQIYDYEDTQDEDDVVVWYQVVIPEGDNDVSGWVAAEFVEVIGEENESQ